MLRCSVAAAGLVCAFAGDARPCSLSLEPVQGSLPLAGSTVGPRPLLTAPEGSMWLLDLDDTNKVIDLVRDESFAETHVNGAQRLVYWRPRDPLPTGRYQWMGANGEANFFVDATLAPEAPVARPLKLAVKLTEPAEDRRGCRSFSEGTSCDDIDFTRLDITFGPASALGEVASVHLLELTADGGATHRDLVSTPLTRNGLAHIGMQDRHAGLPSFKAKRFCLAATPISDDGVLGERVDLGCFRPDDDDPRVSDDRGCTGAGGALNPALWTAALLLGTRRRRRAR